jgi:chorismate dehydratase
MSHDFGPDQQKGLSLYYRLAQELGLLDKPAQLRIWSDNTVIR